MGKSTFHRLLPFAKKPQSDSAANRKLDALKQHQQVVLDLPDDEHMLQLEMIRLTEEELAVSRAFLPYIQQNLDRIVAAFYQAVLDVPVLKALIMKHSSIERLQHALQEHLVEMFSGKIDKSFVQKRIRVAERHVLIGLEPKWYVASFQNLQNELMDIASHYLCEEDRMKMNKVINRVLNFEQQIVLEAYEKENIRLRMQQYEIVKAELKEKIGSISEELAALTEQTSASIEELMAKSVEVSRIASYSSDKSKETHSFAHQGQGQIQQLESRIHSIHHSTASVQESVVKLTQSAEKIKAVIEIVQQIAKQTNLLALNSAIEASRAGEHGRGFSVVAGEVRKLAEQTQHSVKQISELVAETHLYTAHVVESIQEVQSLVTDGLQETAATRQTFGEIVGSMDESIRQIDQVEHEMKLLSRAIDEIGAASDKVAISADTLNTTAHHL